MATRNIWADQYGIGSQVTGISTAVNCAKGIALTNHPHMEAATATINQRKAIGVSYRRGDAGFEYQQGASAPTTTWEFDVSTANMSRILWSFFQTTAFQGAASVYPKYFVPWDSPTVDVWLNLVRAVAASGDSNSHEFKGAIARSITLSANEGENLKASVEFIAESLDTAHNIASDTFTCDADAPFMWQNAKATMDGTTINIPGFSLTMTNNAVSKFYDSATMTRHCLGDFTAEGTLQIPWAQATEGGNVQLNDFVAGNTSRFVIYWPGDSGGEIADADSEFSIITHIRKTGAALTGDDEILTDVTFECVSDNEESSVNVSGSSLSLEAGTGLTGTSTNFDANFDVGDLVYALGASAISDYTVRVITAIASDTECTVFPAYSQVDNTIGYKIYSTPLTITLGDSQNITDM